MPKKYYILKVQTRWNYFHVGGNGKFENCLRIFLADKRKE